MTTTRREFLGASVAAAGALASFSSHPAAKARIPGREAKKILILGGTRFLGPSVVRTAVERGHSVTLFNRGKSRPGLFPDIEQIHGDRDPKKDDGLKKLAGREWDAVIDTSGYYPRIVKASAELLAPKVKLYIFVSSVSVYAKEDRPDADEADAVGVMKDPTIEEMGKEFENYGPLKALCEQAAEAAFPSRTTNVRPGYIVGPEDGSDRFTYWPLRVSKGGDVLAPGTPSDPIQVIDVRDLGAWLVTIIEQKVFGVFNAIGPDRALTMGEVLETSKAVSGSDAKLIWVPADFLEKQGEKGDAGIPIWIPPIPKYAGYHRRNGTKAFKAGLKIRPLKDTVKDTIGWFNALPDERRSKLREGLSPEREAAILAAWKAVAPK